MRPQEDMLFIHQGRSQRGIKYISTRVLKITSLYISHGRGWQEGEWQTGAFVILEGNIRGNMNSLFCYCCQGLLNIFPQNNKGKRVMWNITIDNNSQDQVFIKHLNLYLSHCTCACAGIFRRKQHQRHDWERYIYFIGGSQVTTTLHSIKFHFGMGWDWYIYTTSFYSYMPYII